MEMTNYNVEEKDMQGEPEEIYPFEDIKKLERCVKSQEKKLAAQAGKLPDGGMEEE